jgi:hypothetical protein
MVLTAVAEQERQKRMSSAAPNTVQLDTFVIKLNTTFSAIY